MNSNYVNYLQVLSTSTGESTLTAPVEDWQYMKAMRLIEMIVNFSASTRKRQIKTPLPVQGPRVAAMEL